MKAGWENKALGEVCDVVNGGTPKTGVPTYWDGPNQWITPAEMGKRITPYIGKTERTVTDSGLQNSSARLLPPYSVILSSRAPIGYLVINTEPMATNQGCKGLITKNLVDHKFIFYYLTSIVDLLNNLGSGATFKELSGSKLKEISIPVPPIPEQQRIVAILDEAFDGIATAKANAEKNLQNARAIFESYLSSVFSQRGEGWVEKRFSEIAESISTGPFGTMLHKSDYVPDGIPLVNPMNIVDSKIIPSNKMMINKETRERLSCYILKIGDVVIGRRGELGRCALVTEREAGWLCGTGSFFVRLSNAMNGEFFVALFGSELFKTRLEASAVGTTMNSLNHGILNDLVLPVPPITVQREIMDISRNLLLETQRLESIYRQKSAALDELKKSLLHQAFSGEL